MKATITSKGQITIPARIRERLKLKTGQVLEFDMDAPYLKAHRIEEDEASARRLLGSMKERLKGRSTGEWMEWLRGPVELPPHATKRR